MLAFAPDVDLDLDHADMATLGIFIGGYSFPKQLNDDDFDPLTLEHNEDDIPATPEFT